MLMMLSISYQCKIYLLRDNVIHHKKNKKDIPYRFQFASLVVVIQKLVVPKATDNNY